MLANLKLTDSHRDRGPGLCLSLSSRVRAEFYKLRQRGKSAVPTGSGPGLSLQAASEDLLTGAQASHSLRLLPGIHSCGYHEDLSNSRRGPPRRCCCRCSHCSCYLGHTGVATPPALGRWRLERRPQRALAFQPLQQSSRGVCKSELKEQCWAALGGKGAVQESVASPALQQSRGEA